MIAGWVDPVDFLGGKLDLKRDERNARTTASNSFIFTTDNVTDMAQAENDWWCRLHTGVSETARKLHSDNTKLYWKFRRIGLATVLVMPAGLSPTRCGGRCSSSCPVPTSTPMSTSSGEVREAQARDDGRPAQRALRGPGAPGRGADQGAAGLPGDGDYARLLLAADLAFPGLGDPAQPGLGGLYAAYRHAFEVMVRAGLEDQLTLLVMSLVTRDATRDKSGEKKLTRLPADL